MILVLRVIGKLVLFQLPSLLIVVEDPAKKQDVSKHQHKSKHNTHNIVEFFGVAQIRPERGDQGMPGSKQTNECEAGDLVDVQRSQVGNDGQRSVHDDPFEWNSGEQQSICCLKSEMWGLGVDCEDGKWNNGYQKDEEKGVDDVKARTTRGIAVGTDFGGSEVFASDWDLVQVLVLLWRVELLWWDEVVVLWGSHYSVQFPLKQISL